MFTIFSVNKTAWAVASQRVICGEPLPQVNGLSVSLSVDFPTVVSSSDWPLIGRASHVRYVEKAEKDKLVSVQAGLGRREASCAALIPIKKSDAWWALSQDERRDIFERNPVTSRTA